MTIRILIVVPARSGSKGLIDKNIKLLAGRPLLAWTAEAINQAALPDGLAILSTDSEQYAVLGRQAGLSVPFLRPAAYAGDAVAALPVIEHAVVWFVAHHGYSPEFTLWLQPTSPFRTAALIRQAVEMAASPAVDAVIGCKPIHRDLTTLFRIHDGYLAALDRQQPTQTSRQQQPPLLTPNGAMYLCKTRHLLEHQSFYPPNTVPLVMNTIQSLDIDTEEDWAIAEAYIKQGLV
ncbi:MAG: acylneuraminate cytidylyltransferase family protein [Methylomonas sp.]|nr:acylneuraminate cytidylyltransferase family protein [Methylomonas sp.]PPD22246.1 MAG: N-acylneuraminate cytidylyltransferase [Methylomonas sp.]PPD27782.1 MAG: N-acylneuraminate cytidylyltransferase [Methylomonas sp.]PPD39792.1 MAG: N-acylneuraminate cytidylyltransferase [Methylomonas sp.]PPD42566.1 MAG: N-acylneuraminate cytidylyltransferase [Methylomonas sp.]